MPKNDRILLDGILEKSQKEIDPEAKPSDFFEYFTAEQVLKDFNLSSDEIESGLVGGGQDGGIDAIYLFVDDELVREDDENNRVKPRGTITLIIIQSKTSAGFEETPIERFTSFSDDLFDLSKDLSTVRGVYNVELLAHMDQIHQIYKESANRFPRLKVNFLYASKGDHPSDNLDHKINMLKNKVEGYFSNCSVDFEFLGAAELLELARREPQITFKLPLADTPISSTNQVGFVCLVELRDFFDFITDESGSLRKQILEANVRDYQGNNQVNKGIRETLGNSTSEDFWWLNNGISILATTASLASKTLSLENPIIVNGLQTTNEVYNHFKELDASIDDDRKILAKVMVPAEEDSRIRIINATNRQTSVQAASLRATEKIHRDIEQYLLQKGLFYDRRKNYYKNENKPSKKIISIPYMAQAVMAILLRKPDTARARPSSLLKLEKDYKSVFNLKHPLGLYYVCAQTAVTVEAFLRSADAKLGREHRTNLRFYVAMHALNGTGSRRSPREIAEFDLSALTDEKIGESLEYVNRRYTSLGRTDQIAKGPSLLDAMFKD